MRRPPYLITHSSLKGLKFDVQVLRVSGVPSEIGSRTEDILARCLHYGVCRTSKPPTADDVGNEPEFIGNVVKLHAIPNMKNVDVWEFSKADCDPDTSCSVRLTAEAFVDPNSKENNILSLNRTGVETNASLASDLYLFLELVTIVRVPKSLHAGEGTDIRNRSGRSGIELKKDEADKSKSKSRKEKSSSRRAEEDSDENTDLDDKNEVPTPTSHHFKGHGGKGDREGGSSRDGKTSQAPSIEHQASEPLVSVEFCSGWVMVPLKDIVQGRQIRTKVKMLGGTPFSPIKINKKDVRKRPGTFEALKRMVRINVKSEIELILRPSVSQENILITSLLPPCIILPSSAVTLVALFRESQEAARNLFIAYTSRALPQTGHCGSSVDIVLSSFPKLLADVAACRVLMYFWSKEAPKDILDMRAPSNFASFTQGSGRPAATPHTPSAAAGGNANTMSYSSTPTSQPSTPATTSATAHAAGTKIKFSERATLVFRNIVLRVWKAYCVPESRQSRLKTTETLEETSRREILMRSIVEASLKVAAPPASATSTMIASLTGGSVKNAPALSSTAGVPSSLSGTLGMNKGTGASPAGPLNSAVQSQALVANKKTEELLSIPFNPFEFLWTG